MSSYETVLNREVHVHTSPGRYDSGEHWVYLGMRNTHSKKSLKHFQKSEKFMKKFRK